MLVPSRSNSSADWSGPALLVADQNPSTAAVKLAFRTYAHSSHGAGGQAAVSAGAGMDRGCGRGSELQKEIEACADRKQLK